MSRSLTAADLNDRPALQTVATEAARTVGAHYIAKGRAAGLTDAQIQEALAANWPKVQTEIAELAALAWKELNA